MPRPAYFLGRQALDQATRHCEPEQESSPAQKNAPLFLSNFSIIRSSINKEAMKWVGRLSSTADMRVSLPPLDRREAHHPAKYLSTLSMRGWNADGGSFVGERGRPR
jgi:hypothetical protein